MAKRHRPRREDYTVGWVCALPIELAAAQEMLDEEHEDFDCDARDTNIYTLGRIGTHHVVIACLPDGQIGTNSAAAATVQMKSAFTSIQFGLMVGIGGGVPTAEADIRLGDVVVSHPERGHSGVVQYDFGKATPSGFERTGFLNTPPMILLNAVTKLRANYLRGKRRVLEYASKLNCPPMFARENAGPDVLFEADYSHVGGPACEECSKGRVVERQPRDNQEIVVHHGTIASGNQVMRDAAERDRVSLGLGGVLCFEMEAAGLMNSLPCLVIRGICDYADSHKNKRWQPYAAAVAAAYTKELLNIIPDNLLMSTRTANKAITSTSDEYRRKVYRWLSAPEPSSNYKAACRKRQPATGSWLIGGVQFDRWKVAPDVILWLHGIPGCGKTILCSTIIEDITRYCQLNSTYRIAYFYFDFNDPDKQHIENLIRSLIWQLSAQSPTVPNALQELYSCCGDGSQQPSIEGLIVTFKSILRMAPKTYIILDALDECIDRNDLLKLISEIHNWKSGNIHLLAASRPERDIEEALIQLVSVSICIQSSLISNDIQVHIRQQLQTDLKLNRWPPPVRDEIEDKLVRGANGMFRWVVCQLDTLRKCLSLDSLRKALDSLPKTLDDTYSRILSSIDKEYCQDAFKVLQWLTYSLRPLRLEEVSEVIAVDVNSTPHFHPDRRLREPSDLLMICPGLITISYMKIKDLDKYAEDEFGGNEEEISHEVEVVRLAHFSVKEYLLSDRIENTLAAGYGIREKPATCFIAETCLAYLLQFNKSNSFTPNTLDEFPLTRYAARYWIQHLRVLEDGSSQASLVSLDRLKFKFFGSYYCFKNWILIYDTDWGWRDPHEKEESIGSPLYYAAGSNLLQTVQQLLNRGADANAQGGLFGNALQAATINEHEQVVELLLENGADVNAEGGDYGYALIAASSVANERLVRLLIRKGADINVRDCVRGQTALHAAVGGQSGWINSALPLGSGPHLAVVRLLLESGIDVLAETPCARNMAIHLMADWMHERDEIAQLLVEKMRHRILNHQCREDPWRAKEIIRYWDNKLSVGRI